MPKSFPFARLRHFESLSFIIFCSVPDGFQHCHSIHKFRPSYVACLPKYIVAIPIPTSLECRLHFKSVLHKAQCCISLIARFPIGSSRRRLLSHMFTQLFVFILALALGCSQHSLVSFPLLR